MAKKRMFDSDVIKDDNFSNMPISSQLLYFRMVIEADDDGFVGNVGGIMSRIKAGSVDVDILCEKTFIFLFDSGVALIRHWNIHNLLRKDRYTPTIYLKEKIFVSLAADGTYDVPLLGKPNGNQWLPQERVVEGSIGKVSLEERANLAAKSGKTLEGLSLYSPIRKEKSSKTSPTLPNSSPNGITPSSRPVRIEGLNEKPTYGEFDNVFLADEEYSDLKSKFGEDVAEKYVNRLSRWLYSDPNRSKADHYRTIVVWYKEDEEKKARKAARKNKAASYDLDEYENSSQFD